MSKIIQKCQNILKQSKRKPKIVFVEGWNNEIQLAVKNLNKEKLVEPVLIFRTRKEVPANFSVKFYVVDEMDLSKYAKLLFEIRQSKGMTMEEANKLVKQPNYLAVLLVKTKEADGEICGIEYTTKDTLKPALQIIKTAPDAKLVSSVFIMEKNDEMLMFSDCAININPTSDDLVNMALMAGKFAKDIVQLAKPKIALLSYSTNGSGSGESVDKVRIASQTLKNSELAKNYSIYGEIQFDAAYDNNIRAKKAKDCKWKERPDVYIFPTIDAGNIGYKIAQRMGGYNAFGPVLIGLGAPINDLSRGASADDVIGLTYLTAVQVLANK